MSPSGNSFVIIGNGVAGIQAAGAIRKRRENAQITVISSEHDHFFSRTALMYVHCGQLSAHCVEPYERDHYDRMQFLRVRDRVTDVNPSQKSLTLSNQKSLSYDKLLIASGSVPLPPPWPGGTLDGVGHFVTWQQMEWLKSRTIKGSRAVVIGGGLIGIEAAEVLIKGGVNTTFLVRESHFWPIALSREEGDLITEHMRHHHCQVELSTETEEILGSGGKVSGVRTKDGRVIPCDTVVVTIGVTPQTDFLATSGIERDARGGIVVNEMLATSAPDIWAAGDCTSVVWFNGVRRPEQLWYTSRDQGRIAGANMTGGATPYKRGLFYNSAKFFDIEYTTAGLVNFSLPDEQNWYHQEPGTVFTQRITSLPNGIVVGFNMLGRRWDHRVLLRWIEEQRELGWVLDNLGRARYDEEFMPAFSVANLAGSRK